MIVTVAEGRIEGVERDGIVRFLGIPYAEPPMGELRFAKPVPRKPWQDVLVATDRGPVSPQRAAAFPGMDTAPIVGTNVPKGDDFLKLNIWRPAGAAQALPVMVWIHGGGWTLGSKDMTACDGSAFARSGVICVNINYRLGIEGFLAIPGAPTNLGLRDAILALHWVKRNIAAFGGDPDNVTIFGESAGGMNVTNLAVSPLAKGLFRRIIAESGHASMNRPIAVDHRLVERIATLMGVTPDVAGFRSRTPDECVEATRQVHAPGFEIDLRDDDGVDPTLQLTRFAPVYGDDVLPVQPLRALAAGAGADVDILIGSNADEARLFLRPPGVTTSLKTDDAAIAMLARSQPDAAKVLKAFGMGKAWFTPGEAYERAASDLSFRWPVRRVAEEHRGTTHVYEFTWRSPALDGQLDAYHGLEMPFVFDTLSTVTGPQGAAGLHPPQALADRVHAIWVGFARDGSLPWPVYSRNDRQVYDLSLGRAGPQEASPAAPFMR